MATPCCNGLLPSLSAISAASNGPTLVPCAANAVGQECMVRERLVRMMQPETYVLYSQVESAVLHALRSSPALQSGLRLTPHKPASAP